MTENNIIGFPTHDSTETTILKLTDEYLLYMDKGLINGVLFIDLKKSVDAVNYQILSSKLQLYGIQETAYNFRILFEQ